MTIKSLLSTVSLALLLGGAATAAQAQIPIGHLADYSGATSDVGTPYGQAVADTFAWVNKNGGVGGKKLNVDTNDYGYQVPRAIALYKKWSGGDKVAAIMGWGTADTEALTGFVAQDKIPYFSASYAAALTDPEGASGKAKPAPYNFFYGPSYSDAMRAMLTWAAEDWKAKGKPGKPKFVHMGANHPYPNAPKAAGEALATELGFEVLPPLVFALTPGDYSAQCLSLKSSGANYAYLGNTAASNISVLKACKTAGVDVQFLGNVWGMDENAAKTAADAADGVIFCTPVFCVVSLPFESSQRRLPELSFFWTPTVWTPYSSTPRCWTSCCSRLPSGLITTVRTSSAEPLWAIESVSARIGTNAAW